ncbi:hypothetical protein FOL47_000076 [Perkinsus chesapeaki]|uniref:Uncharacterized protein n=1 Tax=Perkinsus chesapeaki TaxID=330153 RepID=A0A7J6N458_PERCH|nr:hypothetical protein FOL47_000076 [Perkinsus chesapeaki]
MRFFLTLVVFITQAILTSVAQRSGSYSATLGEARLTLDVTKDKTVRFTVSKDDRQFVDGGYPLTRLDKFEYAINFDVALATNTPPRGYYNNCTVDECFYSLLFPENWQLSPSVSVYATCGHKILYNGNLPYKFSQGSPEAISLVQESQHLQDFLANYHLDKEDWKELKYDGFKGLIIVKVNGTEIPHVHN